MSDWIEECVPISRVKELLRENIVEVDSADGWVGVNYFINKGNYPEYVLSIPDVGKVRCNSNHLFETIDGWRAASDLVGIPVPFLTKYGVKSGLVEATGNIIPIVDININHHNHRYYTDGISSHNTGVGKSLFMCHMAAACTSMGKNVLYITLELSEEEVGKRIDANLLNVTFDDLMALSKDMYEKRVVRLKNKTSGKLIVKQYPTAGASVIHFKSLLNELALKKSFKPDIIFVDYLNLCMSARIKMGGSVNSYTYIKSIAEELRGLAVEHNVPIVSATQVNRAGFNNSDIGMENTSESFGLPATADLMIALIATDDLTALGQLMVKQLKNRYNDENENKRFVIGIDKKKMKLFDAEPGAQKNITDSGQEPEKKKFERPVFDKDKFKKLKVS
jgi:hypothetical protein